MKEPALSKSKKAAFWLTALVIVPATALLVLELTLLWAGVGHPTSFFIEQEENGERWLIENQKFGWQFFPREIARSPAATRFKKAKAPGTVRIILFGESAALGDPKPGYGMGRYLEVLLSERYPSQKFEVVVAAMTAINSHALVPIAKECADLGGDAWVIYCGNNEMVGPFGASPLFGRAAPSRTMVKLTLWAGRTRIGQLLEEMALKIRGEKPGANWEGIRMFAEKRIPPGDPARAMVYKNYEENLREMIRIGQSAGAQVLVCAVASNLSDFAPLASHRTSNDSGRWEELARKASALPPNQAAEVWNELVKLEPNHAETHFRRAVTAMAIGDTNTAKIAFLNARELDALPFRADGAQRDITSRLGKEVGPDAWLNLEAELGTLSSNAIPGREWFFDHVHFSPAGNYEAAWQMTRAIEKLMRQRLGNSPKDWASKERADELLGLTSWNAEAAWRHMLARMQEPPFTNQFNAAERTEQMARVIAQMRREMVPSMIFDTRAGYERAIQRRTNDFYLRENYAEFLEATGEIKEAADQWAHVSKLLPHHFLPNYHLGRLLVRTANVEAGIEQLQKALRSRSDLAEARVDLAYAYFRQKKYEQALAEYEVAQKERPREARVLVGRADVLAAQGKRSEAIEQLKQAVALRPSYFEARVMLGTELAFAEQFPAAAEQFREVAKLRPDYAAGHFNLGVALAKMGVLYEALQAFQRTLELNPEHKQAADYAARVEQLLQQRRRPPAPATTPP